MPVKNIIISPNNNKAAFVNTDSGETPGLVVATRPLKKFTPKLTYLLNDTYGIDMNQDASVGGVPEEVHNGTDTILWTGSNVAGSAALFNSTKDNHTPGGSMCVDAYYPRPREIFQFAKGSNLDCNNYESITIWIMSIDWTGVNDKVILYGWDVVSGSVIGTEVKLTDYFAWNIYNVWQLISIPLTDFGSLATSTALNAIRFECTDQDGSRPARYFLDDIQFEQIAPSLEYTVFPEKNTWLYVEGLIFQYADVYGGAGSSDIPYDSFFGMSALNTGLVYKEWSKGQVVSSANIRQHSDLMNLSNAVVSGYGYDGTNSWVSVKVNFPQPIILKYEDQDRLSITISEDLTDLDLLRVSISGYEEVK